MRTLDESKVLKTHDAPIEVLIFDPLSIGIARILANHVHPLAITASALLVRSLACLLVVSNQLLLASACFFFGFVLDAVDGKVARLQQRCIEEHGWWDFNLDQASVAAFIVCTTHLLLSQGRLDLWPLSWFCAYFLIIGLGGTRFRLLGQAGIDWRTPRGTSRKLLESHSSSLLTRLYLWLARIEEPLRKRRMLARPTSIESLFVVSVIAPVFNFHAWTWIVGFFLLLPDMIAIAMAGVLLARVIDRLDTKRREPS